MVCDVLSLMTALGGVIVIVLMVTRLKRLPPLARSAIIGSAFGLLTASRYIEVDRSVGAIIWVFGTGVLMVAVAVRHLKEYPRAN